MGAYLIEGLALICNLIEEYPRTLTLLIKLLVTLWRYFSKARKRKKLSPYRTKAGHKIRLFYAYTFQSQKFLLV